MNPQARGFVFGVAVGIFAYHVYMKSATAQKSA